MLNLPSIDVIHVLLANILKNKKNNNWVSLNAL